MQADIINIHVEPPAALPTLTEAELSQYQATFSSSAADIHRIFEAAGYDREKMLQWLNEQAATHPPVVSEKVETPEPAINTNPAANANIQSSLQGITPQQEKEREQQANNEVTDGEDG